ncbi:hypothetical protein MKZ38_000995 [Zalerion maritima]|uniref:Uncharacterized protein n=1 Tax=Zalerion maritima TaxID=339359 RepID=A0AAD5RS04_9PEZI|nr:hypothetical protein MKZ38_000995 [Zalerion maritima]
MKFGRNLPRNQVPEWADYYINYKGLKKLIRAAVGTTKSGERADLAEFFFSLDRNLEQVESFFDKKFAETYRVLKLLEDRYGRSPDALDSLDQDEAEELLGALLEIRGTFRKLQWFGEINRRGFVKITKKLDKKIPDTAIQTRYISTKVDPKPFAKDTAITRILNEINKWLSLASEAQNFDDSKSDRSTRSLGRASTKALLSVPQSIIDGLDAAIRVDDREALQEKLHQGGLTSSDLPTQTFLLNLLQRCISARSRACIARVLELVPALDESDDINSRNCIHRLVIHIGRLKSSPSQELEPGIPLGGKIQETYLIPNTPAIKTKSMTQAVNGHRRLSEDDEAVQILVYLLDKLNKKQQAGLVSKDAMGRLPLHYAAQYGFVVVCEILQSRMASWGLLGSFTGIDSPPWQDKDGFAPIHIAVLGGHAECTRALMGVAPSKDSAIKSTVSETSHALAIATKADSRDIVKLLVESGANVNWQDNGGETALHMAARFGHVDCARFLLSGGANVDLTENTYAWTPLHIASVDGHLEVLKLIVEAGADVSKLDSSGWNAKEHAALRGHLRIAEYLDSNMVEEDVNPSSQQLEDTVSRQIGSSLGDRRSKQPPSPEPLKTFGHRYLKNETLVLVSLGSMDMRSQVDAVKLDHIPMASAHSTQLDTALSVMVSASGATGQPTTIDLPVHENISTEPLAFLTSDPEKVRIFFDIVPTYGVVDSSKNKVARAVALLKAVSPKLGSTHGDRASLLGDVTVPLLEVKDLEVVGTVHFNFLIVTPFDHPNMEVTSQTTYWKKSIMSPNEPMVIGHRGLGKNLTTNRSLQLGENTVQSLIAAANLGANYVEFDVQLTKDHVPVIYHDFFVSETGIDAPVHTLTLEQFMHMNQAGGPNHRSGSPNHDGTGKLSSRAQKLRRTNSPGPRMRSLSQGIPGTGDAPSAADERMKHTRDFKVKGFKANSRGNFIQAPFATLSQLFDQIPDSTGFNIELKYPMLHESQEVEMDAYAVELNSFVDNVLHVVYSKMGSRHVIFSSFNPDICLCLSFKQPSIPVMFLTDATTDDADTKISDIRASSLQEAVRFASRWNLLGIVAHAEVFAHAPRLVRVVKGMGLMCVSYGLLNNDTEMVQRQVNQGIDAVIVDSVLAIRKGLTTTNGAEAKKEQEDQPDAKLEDNLALRAAANGTAEVTV